MGDAGSMAAAGEGPVLSDRFTYPFWMDTTEVTQSQFSAVTGRNPVVTGSVFGSGDDYPVYAVTWFDAALYCNARSKLAGLDTVYAYTARSRDANGAVYALDGLAIHLDRGGFRLPTEAEWEFAARAGAASTFPWGELKDSALARESAWFAADANGKTHPVAVLRPNAYGLYDLAGNVMEWVNDWKGDYPASPVVDFAGARDPGPEYDIPVKGGAFKFGMRELRPANRTATYATIPSGTSEYVGFRCALGAIAGPGFAGADGHPIVTDKVVLDLPRLQDEAGWRTAKLVFVNASATVRHLAYVDYSQSPVRVREFTDRNDVFHPTISPDGHWAAFGTRLEGVDSGSDVYVRTLDGPDSGSRKIGSGFIPRWRFDPATRDTFIVYTNSAVDDANPRWAATRTMAQKMSGGMPQGAPLTIPSDGGYHDGYSRDGRYLATGFRYLREYDAAAGKARVLFTSPQNGKPPGDTSQVCNVSLAPDTTGRTLFLDFGSQEVSRLTHSAYGVHQIAFVANPAGDVLRWIHVPDQESGFDDLEWSNQADFAVSGARDANEEHRRLYLVNLKDSVVEQIASGTRLLQPALWLGPGAVAATADGLSLDSAGQYDDPAGSAARLKFAAKMHLYWNTFSSVEAALVGSSQMTDGVDPALLTSLQTENYAFGAGDMLGAEFLIRNYLLPHCPKLKLVALSVPIGWLNLANGDFTWTGTVSGSKGILYDQNHDFWKNGLPAGLADMALNVPYDPYGGDASGFTGFPSQGWGGPNLDEYAGPDWGVTDTTYQKNFANFEKLVADLSAREIQVVFIAFPQSPVYATMRSYSVHGPFWPAARDILAQMAALHGRYPLFHLLDFNADGKHDYTEVDAYDNMHLSRDGAAKLSARLDVEIRKLLPP